MPGFVAQQHPAPTPSPFRLQNFITFGTVAFSFVFDKFYLIMD
jgi:hypothetical protein